jgi:SOS-response transcriptional repressor LexA
MPPELVEPDTLTQPARFAVLAMDVAGDETNVGVLLEDPGTDRLFLRLRRDWDQVVPLDAPDEAEVLEALEDGLRSNAAEMGAARLLKHLEDTLSNTIRISEPKQILVHNFARDLGRLYREHVHATVQEFVTHLPRYSLAVAAGKFLENAEVAAEGWEEVSSDLKLTSEMFVARIAGRSMEPRIPDGSSCVFRYGVTGSRNGRLVLVEALGRGANDRYTVKRYRSEKKAEADGSWSHERITLEPLNPEFEAWDLAADEDGYRIVAEFVEVLD